MLQQINLYQQLPKAEPPLLASPALTRAYITFCAFMVILTLLLGVRSLVEHFKLSRLDKNLVALQSKQELASLESIKNNTATITKDLLYLKHLVAIKKTALNDLSLSANSNVNLLTERFSSLSQLAIPQIQLLAITFSDSNQPVSFSGKANSGGAVIYFIKHLKTLSAYQSIYFSDVNVSSDKDTNNLFNFTVNASEISSNDPTLATQH